MAPTPVHPLTLSKLLPRVPFEVIFEIWRATSINKILAVIGRIGAGAVGTTLTHGRLRGFLQRLFWDTGFCEGEREKREWWADLAARQPWV